MEFSAQQLADLLNGTVEGDAEIKVSRLSKIEEGMPGSLSFLGNPIYSNYMYTSRASIIIVNQDFKATRPILSTLIRVENSRQAFASLLDMYNKIRRDKKGIDPLSYIDPSAMIGKDVYLGGFSFIGKNVTIGNRVKIYPNCYVGDNCTIGDETILFQGVKIYSDCVIGKQCNLHAGAVIGSDGFGFEPNETNHYTKVPQIGNVVIEDHVEVGANTTIDRATLGSTIIRTGVKLDNLIQIAHNVEIGENTVIAGQSGIAGSTKIGKNCMIGAQVGIVGHITIADGVKIAGQSGVGASIIKANEIVQGSPAFNISDYKRTYVLFRKLPSLEKKITALEQQIIELQKAGTH